MNLKMVFFKFSCYQSLFKRDKILLVDNTFNDTAELTDNFALFQYLQTKPDYKDKSFYIINRRNNQYAEIAARYPQNIIPVKHGKLSWNLIKKLVTTKYWLDSFQVISSFDPHALMRKGKITTVYMQHGINYFKPGFWGDLTISPLYFNKIVFTNKNERKLFKKYYGYNDDNTILAGLSRWDLIQENPKEKIIFAYFTSRAYLHLNPNANITKTKYYRNILKLLTAPDFNLLLKQNNIKLYVGLHHEMMRNQGIKNSLSHIHLIDDKDIGAVKQKASLLITDFSSMCFDFMIKNKPVIFYHIDAGDKLNKLCSDSFKNDINVENKNKELYNIFYKAPDVINMVKKYVKNDFRLEKEYKKINSKFFAYRTNIREHLWNNLLQSPLNITNELPHKVQSKIIYQYKLFGFLPLCNAVQIGGIMRVYVLGLPIFKMRRMPNGITTKYYILTIPLLKVSKKTKSYVMD